MKERNSSVITGLSVIVVFALSLIELTALAIPQSGDTSKTHSSQLKPSVVKTVIGTITEISHPRAGISVTIMGTDGITYQYGVEEGKIIGATAATLKVGDRVRVEFYQLTTNYPPTYGNPIKTVLLQPRKR